MIKLVLTDGSSITEMSQWLTPFDLTKPCANCEDVKAAVKANDVAKYRSLADCPTEDAVYEMEQCMRCIWYWIDEVVKEN